MNKNCGVCGDRAYGNNFGALSCESCRSFFRRAAKKCQEYKCFYGQNCEINHLSRKFCKKCRFDKCLEIGMNKQLIRNQSNKCNYTQNSPTNGSEISDSTTDTSDRNILIEDNFFQNQDIVPYNCFPALVRGLIFDFSSIEINRLKDLFSATSNLKEQIVRPSSQSNNFMEIMQIMHKRCDIKCRRIVKMSSDMTEFVNLCEDDKIQLLKTGCPHIINLISFINFNFEAEFWIIPIDENNAMKISLDVMTHLSRDLYECQKRFLFSMREELNNDYNILDFLVTIVLFNSNQPKLIKRDLIREKQEFYIYLLQRYLELKYNSKIVAQNKFIRIMNILKEVTVLSRLHELSYSRDSQPNALKGAGPLVEEIYEIE